MSTVRILTAADFELAPRGPRAFDTWQARQPLDNPLGPFRVETYVAPDEEILRLVNEMAAGVSSDYDAILAIVYEDYCRAAEREGWRRSCGVPRRLREGEVMAHVRSRTIAANRDRNGELHATVYISPRWEVKHGIDLARVGGAFVRSDS
jgi:hypothetical protein